MKTNHFLFLLMLIGGGIFYFLIGYSIYRTEHLFLFSAFTCLVTLYIFQLRQVKSIKFNWYFVCGLVFRLLLIFSIPRLSDDFFRFYWDGEIQVSGISAFENTPSEIVDKTTNSDLQLAFNEPVSHFPNGMNSKNYYSIYPYTLQPIFYWSAMMSSDINSAVYWMHIVLLLFEMLSFFLLKKILALSDKPEQWAFIYWLNPLVIIEIVGNLHFEGIAITFILLALYAFLQKRNGLFVFSVILAFGAKLTPIFILPAVWLNWGWKKTIQFSLIIIPVSVLMMVYLIGWTNLPNFWNSVLLYFEKFEFNSGLFTLIRQGLLALTEVDYATVIRPVSTIVFVVLAAYISLFTKEKKPVLSLLWLFVAYFLFGQVTNPWYLTVLIPLAIHSERIYPIIWAIIAFFSYGAFKVNGVEESYVFLALEFLFISYLIYLEEAKRYNLFQVVIRKLRLL